MKQQTKFCSSCGNEIFVNAEICPRCGVRVVTSAQVKSPLLAAILSFIWSGLGQIYNGEVAKGLVFMCIEVIFTITFLIAFISFGAWVVVSLLWILFSIYAIYDAYEVAKKSGGEN